MIFVSPEVGSTDLVPLLERAGLEVSETKLEYADVEFCGRGEHDTPVMIGVEVKRLSELTGDYDRFAGHQLPKMLAHYDHRWLIYEGEWLTNRKGVLLRGGGWRGGKRFALHHGQANAQALRKKLLTLEMCGGMHRQATKDRKDTIQFLVSLYRWWTDDAFDEHRSHIVSYQPKGVIPLTKWQQAIAAWPDLSVTRSKAVARRFNNSIRLASSASVDDWAEIEVPSDDGKSMRRIGMAVATRMVKFLNGEE